MKASNYQNVQILLDRPHGEGMVVSCYADTKVVDGFDPHWREQLQEEAREARKGLVDDAGALQEFERQLGLIRAALGAASDRGARGMAVFGGSGWDRVIAIDSDAPCTNRLVVDEEPFLVPFLLDELRRPRYLVVLTDTHRGQIFEARPGSTRLLAELEEDVPSKNRSAGERWGKQQATIARHRENCILHYFKDLVERVELAWDEHAHHGIILLGEHEVLENFRAELPERLARRVVAELPHAWAGEQPAIEDQVARVASEAADAERHRLVDEIERRLQEGYAVSTGPQEVIEAMANGQVQSLVFGPDLGEVAWRCKNCHSLFTTEEGACPYCKGTCERANLWQEVLARALNHHVDVHYIGPEARRAVPGQIAALLLRDEPQWT